ncbi:MAG: primosomal protein N' [Candidatus Saganbacteria bacterium]|nr:primosomal protein N' [Candidatus Saganbacteria bacterium]
MFAEVILAKASRGIDKIYHYSVPENLSGRLEIGHQVRAPFGFRKEIGYVVGFVEQAEVSKVKEIEAITSDLPLFTAQAVELARWLADYYGSFFITALRLVMPPGTKGREGKGRKPKADSGQQTAGEGTNPLSALGSRLSAFSLTAEQTNALTQIKKAINEEKPGTFLLYGVTGSGKTEVYLQAIAEVIGRGRSAIVMVPEISLTPQLVERFRGRFGDHIAVLHSEFTAKQRDGEWRRAARGEAVIVLGTRSAAFAPLKNPGLIVLDEEYETTYKSEKSPRYHAREVALKLAELNGAVVILGSATPAVETFYKAGAGEYTRLDLPRRIDDRPLPPVEVVDMRQEMKQGNFGVLSRRLKDELERTLSAGEQAILFINRLGFFTFVICRECGYVVECPRCAVSLVYSSSDKRLRCNRCGHTESPPALCPNCRGAAIKYFGSGTQRIEDEVAKLFPAARILRYDRDTTGKRGSHEVFFRTFAAGQADVMIGTQMVTKGLDLASVTLVGIVSADLGLHLPDFHAGEHTFQLLTQVAGRAGRHQLPGKVVLQTYSPDNYIIKAAVNHDYQAFYEQEIEQRRELGYPPFVELVSLLITGADRELAGQAAGELGGLLSQNLPTGVLGPVPAVVPRLRGEWRHQILLKGSDLAVMRRAVEASLGRLTLPRGVRVMVDVEPQDLL